MFFGDSMLVNLFIPAFAGFIFGYFLPNAINIGLSVLMVGYLGYITFVESWEGLAGLVLIYLFVLAAVFVIGQAVGYFLRNYRVNIRPVA